MDSSVNYRSRIVTTKMKENIHVKCWIKRLRPTYLWNVSLGFLYYHGFVLSVVLCKRSTFSGTKNAYMNPYVDKHLLVDLFVPFVFFLATSIIHF